MAERNQPVKSNETSSYLDFDRAAGSGSAERRKLSKKRKKSSIHNISGAPS